MNAGFDQIKVIVIPQGSNRFRYLPGSPKEDPGKYQKRFPIKIQRLQFKLLQTNIMIEQPLRFRKVVIKDCKKNIF